MNEIIINFPGSYEHTLNAIVLALLNEKSLLIKNPYPKLDVHLYNSYLSERNVFLEYVQDSLKVRVGEEALGFAHAAESQRFEIDDPVAIYLALKCGDKIKFRKDGSEDYQRHILLLRRLGFRFFLPARHDEKVYDYDCIVRYKPNKVKYNFSPSNYHLAGFLYKVAAICGCQVEVLAKFDISELGAAAVHPLRIEFENLAKKSDEEDELQKRLAKLSKNKKKDPFHLRISGYEFDCPDEIILPSDALLTAYSTVLALRGSENEIRISNLNKDSEVDALCTILSKLNANCTFQKASGDRSVNNYSLTIKPGELTAKKVDDAKLRICRQAFAPLALAAALTPGKTILRGLPEASSLWRGRISVISEILGSASVRVGEIEDGIVIESPAEYGDIKYHKYADPYLQLFQFCAALMFNTQPLSGDFFDISGHYPDFPEYLKKIRSNAKMIAS